MRRGSATKPANDDGGRLIMVVGAPRSGTTWLAKILDSHPWVIYRHEPDKEISNPDIPAATTDEDVRALAEEMPAYLNRLMHARHANVAAISPFFSKAYHNKAVFELRRYLIRGLQRVNANAILPLRLDRFPVPDLTGRGFEEHGWTVIKSVLAISQINLYREVAPEARFVAIIRHPCGHVNSYLKGVEHKHLRAAIPVEQDSFLHGMANMDQAKRRKLTFADFKSMTFVDRLIWRWILFNEKAIEDAKSAENVKLVLYEDLCERPDDVSKEIVAFCGLDWDEQTSRFIKDSTTSTDAAGYYDVVRNARASACRWQQELDPEIKSRVAALAYDTEPGRLFREHA